MGKASKIVIIGNIDKIAGQLATSGAYSIERFPNCTDALSGGRADDSGVGGVLVALDLGLNTSGINVLDQLRETWPFAPLIVVSGASSDPERVSEALATGASDYLDENATTSETIGRLSARVAENAKRQANDVFKLGSIRIDTANRVIFRDDNKRFLSPTEMNLLHCLVSAQGTVVHRDIMKRRCWGQGAVSDNALNRKLHEVRRALKELSDDIQIKTIYGTGFKLEVRA